MRKPKSILETSTIPKGTISVEPAQVDDIELTEEQVALARVRLREASTSVSSLEDLRDLLNSIDRTNMDLNALPKFGGFKPACSGGVFSWDETRILVHEEDVGFVIQPREKDDVMPEPGTPEYDTPITGEWGRI